MRSFINYLLRDMLGLIKEKRDWQYDRYNNGKFRGASAPTGTYWMCEMIWYRIIVRNSGENGHVTALDPNVRASLKLLLFIIIKEIVFGS
jgi:hypothetical protein